MGGVVAQDNAHHGADQEAQANPIEGNDRVQFEKPSGGIPTEDAAQDANDPADLAEHDGLDNELRHDVTLLGADRTADADFAGALGDRDEHDVHDADARRE